MTTNKAFPLILSCLASIALGACDSSDEMILEPRSVLFDAEEVNEILAENPDEVFFVDLRDGATYGFDQRVETFNWDNFIVQCPSMVAPVSMPDYIQMIGLDASPSFWTIESAIDDGAETFRAIGTFPEDQPDLNCVKECVDGADCVWVCSN